LVSESERAQGTVLTLLAEDRMTAVLRALADGPQRPSTVEQKLGASHSVVFERLNRLVDLGLLSHEHRPGEPPHSDSAGVPQRALYGLRDAGRAVLDVVAQAERWDAAHQPAAASRPGSMAIKLLGDRYMRAILFALADGVLQAGEIAADLLDLGRSSLRRRLRELALVGMLQAHQLGRTRSYELTCAARRLASVAIVAARWEWRWGSAQRSLPAADELGAILSLIAPATRLSRSLAGVCRLQVQCSSSERGEIFLDAHAGRVRILSAEHAPAQVTQAIGLATPDDWSEALLSGELPQQSCGDQRLLVGVLRAVATALSLQREHPAWQKLYVCFASAPVEPSVCLDFPEMQAFLRGVNRLAIFRNNNSVFAGGSGPTRRRRNVLLSGSTDLREPP
jgi:DNA-binding HxlR family transcriptional regulator